MISPLIIDDALTHAKAMLPNESCGVVINANRRARYVPCRNLSEYGSQFVIHPEDIANAEDMGDVLAIVHSHPDTAPDPSHADLLGIERTQLPWLIVNPRTGKHTISQPFGYKAPLLGRDFVHGISDCYSLVQDYYRDVLSIVLPEIPRPDFWWLKGMNILRESIEQCGFIELPLEEMRTHDMLVMRMGAQVDNHCAVYVGENIIMQHVASRLSSRDVYGGYWRNSTTSVLRHKTLL